MSTYCEVNACLNSVLSVKAVVATFNQEKAMVGTFSVITNLHVDHRLKLYLRVVNTGGLCDIVPVYPGEHAAAAPVARCRRGGRGENRMD